MLDFNFCFYVIIYNLGSIASVKLILEISGCEVLSHRDNKERTPLILATMCGHGELVNYLLSEGGWLFFIFRKILIKLLFN